MSGVAFLWLLVGQLVGTFVGMVIAIKVQDHLWEHGGKEQYLHEQYGMSVEQYDRLTGGEDVGDG